MPIFDSSRNMALLLKIIRNTSTKLLKNLITSISHTKTLMTPHPLMPPQIQQSNHFIPMLAFVTNGLGIIRQLAFLTNLSLIHILTSRQKRNPTYQMNITLSIMQSYLFHSIQVLDLKIHVLYLPMKAWYTFTPKQIYISTPAHSEEQNNGLTATKSKTLLSMTSITSIISNKISAYLLNLST